MKIKTINRVFDTWKWRKYIPFWRERSTPIINHMADLNLPYREYRDIFVHHGDDFYEIIKKLTVDRMLDEDFSSLTDNEKAAIGATVFLEFMKALVSEIDGLDREDK